MVIYGRKGVFDLVNQVDLRAKINQVYLLHEDKELLCVLNRYQINYMFVKRQWFTQQFRGENHQYCAIFFHYQPYRSLHTWFKTVSCNDKNLVVILNKIQDPHNFGAILRSCLAFRVAGVIIPSHHQVQLLPSVLKASGGIGWMVPLVVVHNLLRVIEFLQNQGYWIYATGCGTHYQNFYTVDYASKTGLVLGNEAKGVAAQIIKQSDYQITIPMDRMVDSLNVATAAGILLSWIQQKMEL